MRKTITMITALVVTTIIAPVVFAHPGHAQGDTGLMHAMHVLLEWYYPLVPAVLGLAGLWYISADKTH